MAGSDYLSKVGSLLQSLSEDDEVNDEYKTFVAEQCQAVIFDMAVNCVGVGIELDVKRIENIINEFKAERKR